MTLTISPITSPQDFNKIHPMDHIAWQTPYNPQLKHFRPQLSDPEEAIAWTHARDTKRFRERGDHVFMIKATDDATGEIVGWAVWEVEGGQQERTVASWYPEGSEERAFAEIFINGLWGFIGGRVGGRRCLDLASIVVAPEHRGRGAARLLIRWGTAKADELGIETVISSLPSAKGVYERCGFGAIEVLPPDPELWVEREGRGDKWKELLEDDLSGWLMWRPVGRDWKEGDRAPWVDA
ncbi:hypothetical protein BDW02DRAFT_572637 [Decorospora gaudefroyi]|uniref:N-acetyltransferase domain-containing protein n=1 Tax=Decorospora gaudefroyi TaxID=184978 RepID=A0A6A5K836_9PLEO|nr:hypothetical protein BDW02DRAFT_572637 [Decorospora gaudefroyi]